MQPTVGSEVVSSVGGRSEILASDENLIKFSANMGRYSEHDWCYDMAVPSAPGVSAGQSIFPQGALLGQTPCASPAWPHAYDANEANHAVDVPADRSVYTWASAAFANRGVAGTATIPESGNAMAVVLEHDTDIADYLVAGDGYPLVSIIWQGIFVPRGIQQDAETYDVAVWPTALGSCDRLSIVPNYGHMVG